MGPLRWLVGPLQLSFAALAQASSDATACKALTHFRFVFVVLHASCLKFVSFCPIVVELLL